MKAIAFAILFLGATLGAGFWGAIAGGMLDPQSAHMAVMMTVGYVIIGGVSCMWAVHYALKPPHNRRNFRDAAERVR